MDRVMLVSVSLLYLWSNKSIANSTVRECLILIMEDRSMGLCAIFCYTFSYVIILERIPTNKYEDCKTMYPVIAAAISYIFSLCLI